jgi:hypothetical protein
MKFTTDDFLTEPLRALAEETMRYAINQVLDDLAAELQRVRNEESLDVQAHMARRIARWRDELAERC